MILAPAKREKFETGKAAQSMGGFDLSKMNLPDSDLDEHLKNAEQELKQAKSEINSPASDALIDCIEHILDALKIIRSHLSELDDSG